MQSQTATRALVPTRSLLLVGFLAVAGQRVGIPGLGISVATAALIALWLGLLLFCRWQVNATGLLCYVLIGAAGLMSFLVNPDTGSTVTSILLLLATYLPLLLMSSDRLRRGGAGQTLLYGMLGGALVGAALSIVQAANQLRGGSFIDPLQQLPAALQVQGFNTQYSTEYVESAFAFAFKPNGMVFLEPSFLSLYSCLGLVWVLWQLTVRPEDRVTTSRRLGVVGLVFALAFAFSISTSGLPLLALAALSLGPRLAKRPAILMVGVALVAVAWISGLLNPVIVKATEGLQPGTSTNLRLVAPYEILLPFFNDRPLLGYGPGSGSTIVDRVGIVGLQESTVVKALLEYGLIGVTMMGIAALVALSRGWSRAPRPILLAAFAAWLIPADALVNATLVALVFFVVPNWQDEGQVRKPSPSPEERHPRALPTTTGNWGARPQRVTR